MSLKGSKHQTICFRALSYITINHKWATDRKDDFDIEKVYIFQKKVVSVLLFPNGIRRVKEIAMMGMGLGLHTYQALSFTFLISFFYRYIFST